MVEILKFFLSEEWKGKYSVAAAFLFIFTAVLLTYLCLPGIDKLQFSVLFWIVMIFTTLQGISRPFMQMRKNNFVFWQQICSPRVFLTARLISSFILMMVFTLFAYVLFALMHGNPGKAGLVFLAVCVFTGSGISSVFTIMSSIAGKTEHPGALLPVLTFPLILPLLLIGSKAGKKAMDGTEFIALIPDLGLLLLLNLLILVMGLVLIRFIWKE